MSVVGPIRDDGGAPVVEPEVEPTERPVVSPPSEAPEPPAKPFTPPTKQPTECPRPDGDRELPTCQGTMGIIPALQGLQSPKNWRD